MLFLLICRAVKGKSNSGHKQALGRMKKKMILINNDGNLIEGCLDYFF